MTIETQNTEKYYEVAFPRITLKEPVNGKFSHNESSAGGSKVVYRFDSNEKAQAESLVKYLRTEYYSAVPHKVELREKN